MRILLTIFLLLTSVRGQAQSIDYRLFAEPVSSTLISDIEINITPKHYYKVQSIPRPYLGFEIMRTTKSSWGYGFRVSHWWDAKYVSFDYLIPSDDTFLQGLWMAQNHARLYEIIHVSADLVISKTINRCKISVGTGVVGTSYFFVRRYQVDDLSVGIVLFGNDNFLVREGGLKVERGGRFSNGLMMINTAHFEYELSRNVHVGVSLKYLPNAYVLAKYRSWEQMSTDPDEPHSFGGSLYGDTTHDVASFNVKEDKLKLGFSIGYQLSRKLKQKRKKRRKSEKEQTMKQ